MKKERIKNNQPRIDVNLGGYREPVDAALQEMAQDEIIARIWDRDHTIWKPDPAEISDRLGWLDAPQNMTEKEYRRQGVLELARQAGYTQALLLGIGGSSLAPKLFSLTFGYQEGYLDLKALASTAPEAVLAQIDRLDPARTLFVVASKSGTTTETLSFLKFFYHWMLETVGPREAGKHFVAITDPDSHLDDLSAEHAFLTTFLNDPDIGGRYAALSYFGLVPATLVGVEVPRLLDNALLVREHCGPDVPARENPAAWLGAILGELAQVGRDKLTLVTSPRIASFGDWAEQLVAESTGKQGMGILPVVHEPLGPPDLYSPDRLFVHLRLAGDESDDRALGALVRAGHPLVRLNLGDRYALGGQFFMWELAVAIAGYRLGIHPFNQPNVESTKIKTRQMVNAYRETGQLGQEEPVLAVPGVSVYGDVEAGNLEEALTNLVDSASPNSYLALQAFIQPTAQNTAALQELRLKLRARSKFATTLGYGPSFLHSTGQLYKGDAGNGLFIQFTSDHPRDAAIPDEIGEPESSLSFGALIQAQALGDWQALKEAGRQVIRFHLEEPVTDNILRLARQLA